MLIRINGQYLIFQPILKIKPKKHKSKIPVQREERCRQLLQELELTEASALYPSQLSGGMAQRVSLGRTLFYDPELILMDEPFSALDYFTRRNLQDMVLRLFHHQKKTILFVTHDVEEALLLGDRILVMENGNIKADMSVNLPTPRKAARLISLPHAKPQTANCKKCASKFWICWQNNKSGVTKLRIYYFTLLHNAQYIITHYSS